MNFDAQKSGEGGGASAGADGEGLSAQVLYTRGGATAESTATSASPLRSSRAPLELPKAPYPGLRPFTRKESRLFCGRAMERLRLLNLLATSDFLAVLGSSGSGKSSLVLSGLLPDVQSGKLAGSKGTVLHFATFRPGRNPYANLASALHGTWLGEGVPDPFFMEERLRTGPQALARLVAGENLAALPASAALSLETSTEESLPVSDAAMGGGAEEPARPGLQSQGDAAVPPGGDPAVWREDVRVESLPGADDQAAPPVPKPGLLIVVDQFEEIFRFADLVPRARGEEETVQRDFVSIAGPLDEAQAFISLLLASARESAGRVRVVITMRSDFFKHCEVFEGLPEAIAAHQFITPRMSREQMEDAVQIPLSHFGSDISEDLVNDMLNDVHGEFDQLPVLQHALARMWNLANAEQPSKPEELTAKDYSTAGLLSGAMNDHGEKLIASSGLNRACVERFFRCLGDFDPTSGEQIRRPRTVAQIKTESGLSDDEVARIVRVFARPVASFIVLAPPFSEEEWETPDHLVPGAETIVDLTHECLLRKWKAYTDWMKTERKEGKTLRDLKDAMESLGWNGERNGSGDHISEGQYHRFRENLPALGTRPRAWGERYGCDAADSERFLATEFKTARKARTIKAGAFIFVVVGVAAALAYISHVRAESKAAQFKSLSIASEAQKRLSDERLKTAEAEKKLAEEQIKSAAAEKKLADEQAQRDATQAQISKGQSEAQKELYARVGSLETQLSATESSNAGLKDVAIRLAGIVGEKGHVPEDLEGLLEKLGVGLMSSLPPVGEGPGLKTTPVETRNLNELGGMVSSLAMIPGTDAPFEPSLLIGGNRIWTYNVASSRIGETSSDSKLEPVSRMAASVLSVSNQDDSDGWVVACHAGPELMLSKDGGTTWSSIQVKHPVVRARLIAGQRIVYCTSDGMVGMIDASPEQPKDENNAFGVVKSQGTINDVVVSADGSMLVASSDESYASFWSIPKEGLRLKWLMTETCGAPVRGASFSPDSRWALLPSGEKVIKLLLLKFTPGGEAAPGAPSVPGLSGAATTGKSATLETLGRLLLPHDNPVVAGAFSPNGKWIATGDAKGVVSLWRSVPLPLTGKDAQPVGVFTGHSARIAALAWAPGSEGVATSDEAGTTIVWRLRVGDTVSGVPLVMPQAKGIVKALSWADDSSLLAMGTDTGMVVIEPIGMTMQGPCDEIKVNLAKGSASPLPGVLGDAWVAFDLPPGADLGDLDQARVRVTNRATGKSELARIWAPGSKTEAGPLIAAALMQRLGLMKDDEVELTCTELDVQAGVPGPNPARVKAAEYILGASAQRDGQKQLVVRTPKLGGAADENDVGGIGQKSQPELFAWLETLIKAGMQAEAERAVLDSIMYQTDIVDRWLDSGAQDGVSRQPGPVSLAMQAFLRCAVWRRGSAATARVLQLALNLKPSGVVDDATKAALQKKASIPIEEARSLLESLATASVGVTEAFNSLPKEIRVQRMQRDLDFARSFLTVAAPQPNPL